MGRKLQPLPRQRIQVDDRGRITLPEYLREASGIEKRSWIEIEAYPDLSGMKCKALTIKKV